MRVPCYNCDTVTELEVGFEVVNFVCPNCHSLYWADSEGQLRLRSKFKPEVNYFNFKIGDKGFLKGSEYRVTGAITKKINGGYHWREYILKNDAGDFVYLSESDGHWIFLTEMEEKFDVRTHPKSITYNSSSFHLYEYSDTEIDNAQGYFDFELPTKRVHLTEYIQPPLMISIEKRNGVETAFLGEYISKKEIKKGFPNVDLPYQSGVNIVQPYYFDVNNTAIIFCIFLLMIITTNWYIYKDQAEQVVFDKAIAFTDFNDRELTSGSFVLKGGSAPVTVQVSTDVDNSWANVDVALVNETTNDEIHANKDIEYYHGYEDGESWTEGNWSEKFNICGVKAGKYHLLIKPLKAPEDSKNTAMKVKVVWNQPSSRNVWIIAIFMIVVYIVIRYFKINFEKTRWEDSSYSPYSE
ncbi:DUF4178 domain-containing protein [Flavobacterium sp. SLB02]|jgi:hypothetical protein|uniref:DUF4178 domain-containing protein n=1 Tax=Flavobacterium sp. SLB02 TaxID=2665645 RepID=UPI0012A7C10C|nr:DUF4178 domain-containing protein [Flavobacterium sp. SLB02]QGK75994.1 DUF4178 domain-containing protein [Flavobacterium sp. SLB02]